MLGARVLAAERRRRLHVTDHRSKLAGSWRWSHRHGRPSPTRSGKATGKDDSSAILATGGIPLASTPLLQGWSARVTTGLATKFERGGAITVGGEYGGIGGTTHIWTGRARVSVPF